jgi:phosphoribosylaminoimidazole-succinocarboxamide synthase
MASWNFKKISKKGVKTHFRRFIPDNKMEVNLVRVLYPGKDVITRETSNYLIPLEIIFRNSLPSGSSIFRLLESGKIKLRDIGLDHMPVPGEKLDNPIIDLTTKLEASDRHVNWEEAKHLAGLDDELVEGIKELTLDVNDFLTRRAEEIGLEHADGKIELALDPDRNLMLVDVFGTLDENRFLIDGFHISKQILRDYYRKTKWFDEFEWAKKELLRSRWPEPQKLPKELINSVSDMYKAVCEMWIGEKIWNINMEKTLDMINEFL